MTIPADIARCPGVWFPDLSLPGGIDWREGCEDCLRRTSPPADPERVWMMAPPVLVMFECEARIAP